MGSDEDRPLIPCLPLSYPRTGGTLGHSILICGKRTDKFPYCKCHRCFVYIRFETSTSRIISIAMQTSQNAALLVGPHWYCLLVTYSLMIIPTLFFLIKLYVDVLFYQFMTPPEPNSNHWKSHSLSCCSSTQLQNLSLVCYCRCSNPPSRRRPCALSDGL